MIDIIAYEMIYTGNKIDEELCIEMAPFSEEIYEEYEKIYNECFFEMRRALDVQPYNFYLAIEQLENRKQNIYVLCNDNTILGSVACYGNEIDDLIVNKRYQNKGIGRKLLLWAIEHIRKNNNEPIILHVAKWNEKALKLYLDNGFKINKIERVR